MKIYAMLVSSKLIDGSKNFICATIFYWYVPTGPANDF